jgi:hypothetical protein
MRADHARDAAGLAGGVDCSAANGEAAAGAASCGAPPAADAEVESDPALKPANKIGHMLFIGRFQRDRDSTWDNLPHVD